MTLPTGSLRKILEMDEDQLKRFLSNLSPSALEYLEIMLDKAEKELDK